MTLTIYQRNIGRYCVSFDVDKTGVYKAQLSETYDGEIYTVLKSYRNIDRKKALAAYRRYTKQIEM